MTRRQAIEGAGAIAAAMVATSGLAQSEQPRASGQPMPAGAVLPSTPPSEPRAGSVGIAVIGLGDYALKQILPRIAQSQRIHLAALVSGIPEKLTRVGEAYGIPASACYSYDGFAAIAQNRSVEAVYVILPTGLHVDWACRAFAAGKHVLCEKPMALSSAQCEQMIAASERAGRKLMVAYRCHFEPFNRAAMALTRERALGDLRLIRTEHSYRLGPATPATNWRVARAMGGASPMEDYGLYGLQAALYLTGEMPDRVSATAHSPAGDPRFSEFHAHIAALLHFPSGTAAQIVTSYDSAGINMVEARGTHGAFKMHPATGYDGNTLVVETGETTRALQPGDPEVQFAAMLDHFAAAIRDGASIITPGEMGLRDMRLIEAIHTAAADQRTVALAADGTMLSG